MVDPAGGSWYIEWYSNEVAKSAWSLFQQIEAQGGMIRAFASGWVGEQMKPAEAAREKDIAVRKVVVTGISEHPSLTEKRPEQELPNYRQLAMAAAQRLSNWRRQHGRPATLDTLAGTPAGSGLLTAAAIIAAEAGATLGQIAEKLVPTGTQPTVVTLRTASLRRSVRGTARRC